jgi:hypothetical protein
LNVGGEPWKQGQEVIGGEDAAEVGPKRNEEDKVGRTKRGCLASLRGIMGSFGAVALTISVLRAGLESGVEVGNDERGDR